MLRNLVCNKGVHGHAPAGRDDAGIVITAALCCVPVTMNPCTRSSASTPATTNELQVLYASCTPTCHSPFIFLLHHRTGLDAAPYMHYYSFR